MREHHLTKQNHVHKSVITLSMSIFKSNNDNSSLQNRVKYIHFKTGDAQNRSIEFTIKKIKLYKYCSLLIMYIVCLFS